MPSIRSLTVGKEALKKLSNAAIDYDVRPHELVDAIVVHTNWETQVDKLVKIIRDAREKGVAPVSDPESHPESDNLSDFAKSRTGVAPLSDPSRTALGPESDPRKGRKTEKEVRESPSRTRVAPLGPSEERKT